MFWCLWVSVCMCVCGIKWAVQFQASQHSIKWLLTFTVQECLPRDFVFGFIRGRRQSVCVFGLPKVIRPNPKTSFTARRTTSQPPLWVLLLGYQLSGRGAVQSADRGVNHLNTLALSDPLTTVSKLSHYVEKWPVTSSIQYKHKHEVDTQ